MAQAEPSLADAEAYVLDFVRARRERYSAAHILSEFHIPADAWPSDPEALTLAAKGSAAKCDELGARSKNKRADILYRLTVFWNDRNYGDDVVPPHMNIQEFLDWCEAEDPVEEIPQDTVMASRVSLLLRGSFCIRSVFFGAV